MRLVYMDEAGISNPDHEPFVVVSGVIVHGDEQLSQVEVALDDLVRQFIPTEHQTGFVFHATELFNGGGKVFNRDDPRWGWDARAEIADSLAALPKKLKLPLTFGWCERHAYGNGIDGVKIPRREMTKGAHAAAFLPCAKQVEFWMRLSAPSEHCILVIENNDTMRGLINEVQDIYRSAHGMHKFFGPDAMEKAGDVLLPFEKIKHRPLWDIKQPSSVLQLADFCAYVWKKHLMKNQRYDRFWRPLYEQLGVPLTEYPWGGRSSELSPTS